MTTTIKDFGRHSDRFGNIPKFNWATCTLWFRQNQVAPDDVHTWLINNASDLYRVVMYTHKDSKRIHPRSKVLAEKVVYVDKIYLKSADDAMMVKLAFDVQEVKVNNRPRLKQLRRKRALKKALTVSTK